MVGSDLSGMVFFKDGEFLDFSTPNKDFTMHLGGWVQWDNVWWNQRRPCRSLRERRATRPESRPALPPAASTAAPRQSAGRRLLPPHPPIVQEGTYWETGEYRFNWALENEQCTARPGSMKCGSGKTDIPVIGSRPRRARQRRRSVWKAI